MDEKTITTPGERVPIFSKKTDKLLGRVDARGVYFWEKGTKSWELWTWEELERMKRGKPEARA